MALFSEVVKKSAQTKKRDQFWDSVYGPYSLINGIDKLSLTPQALRAIQLGIIKKQIKVNSRLKQANELINNLPKYKINETEEMVANQIFERIATILNSPFKSGNQLVRDQSDKAQELNLLLKSMNINLPISDSIISVLSRNDIITKSDSNFYTYRAEKARLFEEIVAAYFQDGKNNAITTGSWGKISDYNRALITDIYVFLNQDDNKKLQGSYTTYQKSGDWKQDIINSKSGLKISVQSNIDSFIKELDKLNKTANIGISIDDELADSLDTLSSLKVQAKSGINQSILNNSLRNAFSLSEFADYRLSLLYDLYSLDAKNGFKYFYKTPRGSSQTLESYTNYLLSINIARSSLIQSNDIYFTEKGFETVYDWMKNRNVYLKFQGSIKLNAQLLSQKRKYNFSSLV